jgi:hypothetical protein
MRTLAEAKTETCEETERFGDGKMGIAGVDFSVFHIAVWGWASAARVAMPDEI